MRLISNIEPWLVKSIKKEITIDISIEHLTTSKFILEENNVELIFGFSYVRNLTEAGNLCDVLRYFTKRKKITSITFLSSYGVYEPTEEAMKETGNILPKNLIGNLSLMIENTLKYLCELTNFKLNIIRMFNLYGPGQEKPYIVPTLLNQIAKSGKVFIGDSEKVRDFIYIDDFISLLTKIIDQSECTKSCVFNAGTGVPVSIDTLIRIAQMITGGNCEVIFDATRIKDEYDYDYVVADTSKIKKDLKWEPKIDLEQGLSLTYQWILGRSER